MCRKIFFKNFPSKFLKLIQRNWQRNPPKGIGKEIPKGCHFPSKGVIMEFSKETAGGIPRLPNKLRKNFWRNYRESSKAILNEVILTGNCFSIFNYMCLIILKMVLMIFLLRFSRKFLLIKHLMGYLKDSSGFSPIVLSRIFF